STMLHYMLAGLAWNQNDPAAMERELELTRTGGPEGAFMVAGARIALAEYHGQLKQARVLEAKLEEMAKQANFKESAAAGRAQQAGSEAGLGFRSQPIAAANAAIRNSQSEHEE